MSCSRPAKQSPRGTAAGFLLQLASSLQGTAVPTPMGARTQLLAVRDAMAVLSPGQGAGGLHPSKDAVTHRCFSSVVSCSVPYGSTVREEEGVCCAHSPREAPGASLCQSAAVRRHEMGVLMG